jgi:hypothetical protein
VPIVHQSPKVEESVCGKMGLKPAPISIYVIQHHRHAEYLSTIALICSTFDIKLQLKFVIAGSKDKSFSSFFPDGFSCCTNFIIIFINDGVSETE